MTWQTGVEYGSAFAVGLLANWLAGMRPNWRPLMDRIFAVLILGVAVMIAFGQFSRWDAVWPVVVALNLMKGVRWPRRSTGVSTSSSAPQH